MGPVLSTVASIVILLFNHPPILGRDCPRIRGDSELYHRVLNHVININIQYLVINAHAEVG